MASGSQVLIEATIITNTSSVPVSVQPEDSELKETREN